jgi:plastocyanin
MASATVAITVDDSADKIHCDFTYNPTTLHLLPGDTVTFRIEQGTVPVEGLLLIFPHSPFRSGSTELRVGAQKPLTESVGSERGVFHYKSIDDSALKYGRPVYDIWCPSIIVD